MASHIEPPFDGMRNMQTACAPMTLRTPAATPQPRSVVAAAADRCRPSTRSGHSPVALSRFVPITSMRASGWRGRSHKQHWIGEDNCWWHIAGPRHRKRGSIDISLIAAFVG
jgi:hypothetical protein